MYYMHITMETISFKVKEQILNKIDSLIAPLNFNNRTEFIREAIREKLNKIETEIFLSRIKSFKGKAKTEVGDKKLHDVREDLFKEYAKKFDV